MNASAESGRRMRRPVKRTLTIVLIIGLVFAIDAVSFVRLGKTATRHNVRQYFSSSLKSGLGQSKKGLCSWSVYGFGNIFEKLGPLNFLDMCHSEI